MAGQEITGDVRRAPGAPVGGKWLTAKALTAALAPHGRQEAVVTVHGLTAEKVRDQRTNTDVTKQALWFAGQEKGLLLNATNQQVLGEALGWDARAWTGARVGLYVTQTPMGDGVRVRVIAPAGAQPAPQQQHAPQQPPAPPPRDPHPEPEPFFPPDPDPNNGLETDGLPEVPF